MTRQIIVHGLDRILEKLDRDMIAEPLKDFFTGIGITIQKPARENAPVDTGHLRNAIQYEVDKSEPSLWARVGLLDASPGSPLWLKGRAMEYGTGKQGDSEVGHKSGHWPPGPALDVWARRHGMQSGAQVARAIGKRGGLKPRKWLRGAFESSKGELGRLLNKLGNDILARWERG